MLPSFAFILAIAPAGHATGPRNYPPTYIPVESPFGYLYQPAIDLHPVARFPAVVYHPQPGDVILLSDTNLIWTLLYRIALTGKPGHSAVVVRMADGRLGALEAGYNDTIWMRVTPLDYRLNQYQGTLWIRRRLEPLTPEQDHLLTEFAEVARDRPYALGRFAIQLTPLRSRGPLSTFVSGRPRGIGYRYHCAEAVIEALLHTGLIDPRTARPAATYPQDIFYDRSRNVYIDRHPPLAGGWDPPRLWTPVPGSTLAGKDRPRPPSPWPGFGANVVYPVATMSQKAPAPRIVGYVPSELRPITLLQQSPQRIGLFDRPGGLFRRHH
jgi:hypothetical protein